MVHLRSVRLKIFPILLACANASALAGIYIVLQVGRPRFMSFFLILLSGLIIFNLSFAYSYIGRILSFGRLPDIVLDPRVGVSTVLSTFCIYLLVGQGFLFLLFLSISLAMGVLSARHREQAEWWGIAFIVVCVGLLLLSESLKGSFYSDTGDPIHHIAIIKHILETGSISGAASPRKMPYLLFHVMSAVLTRLTGQIAFTSATLFVAIAFQTGAIFYYLFLRGIFGGAIASIGVAIMSAIPPVAIAGSTVHYRSLSFIFLLIFVYLIVSNNDYRKGAIAMIVILSWILTHHISILLAAVFLIGLYFSITASKVNSRPSLLCLILGLSFLFYFVATGSLGDLIIWVFYTSPAAKGMATTGYQVSHITNPLDLFISSIPTFLAYVYYVPILGIGGFGVSKAMMSGREDIPWKLISGFSIPALLIFIPNPSWVFLEGVAEIPRWHLIAAPFFGAISALGLTLSTNETRAINITHSTVVFITILLLVFTAPNNGDLVDMAGFEKEPQRYINEMEMAMIDHTMNYPPGNQIHSYSNIPLYLSRFWDSTHERPSIRQLEYGSGPPDGAVLFSKTVLEENAIGLNRCLKGSRNLCSLIVISGSSYEPFSARSDKVYSNGGATIHLNN